MENGATDLSQEARLAEARSLFDERIRAGLQMNPPFKGFGIALLWFAMDEPECFRLLMRQDTPSASLKDYIDTHIGFRDECVAAIQASVGPSKSDAETLYYEIMPTALGLASAIVDGGCTLSIREASEIIGKSFRAFLLELRAGKDERVAFVPQEGDGPRGSVESYVDKGMVGVRKRAHTLMLNTLVSQNRLLQELHNAPRYVQDREWTELDRVLRNTFEITSDSLKKRFPTLTPGDIRLILLSRFQFSIAESAALLGISPTSVTKARQRLKGRLGSENVHLNGTE